MWTNVCLHRNKHIYNNNIKIEKIFSPFRLPNIFHQFTIYPLLRNTNCCLDNIVKAGYIPKHVGSLPDHSPFCWQSRWLWPIRRKPRSQEYNAVDPTVMPVCSTLPFSGSSSSPHLFAKKWIYELMNEWMN